MTIGVLGIDPGLEGGKSHAALVLPPSVLAPSHAPRYTLHSTFTLDTPEDGPLGVFPLALHGLIGFVAVESARGEVIKGRSGDGVLRNAMMSGRIQSHAAWALGVPVGSVPALGTEQGWNWRAALGCAGMADAGVRMIVERRLDREVPRGVRGGENSHYADAAGVAVAALDRLLGHDPALPTDPALLHQRWHGLSVLEQGVKDVKKDRRTARRRGRALQKKVSS